MYVCAKAKVSSIEVEGVRDGDRPNLTEVTNLGRGVRARQVAFTQNRMFVLSTNGDVYLYKIAEDIPPPEEMGLLGRAAQQIRGELKVDDAPVKITDLRDIKQIACGIDHVLFLDKKGDVYAMGDDTFGQCGAGGEDR